LYFPKRDRIQKLAISPRNGDYLLFFGDFLPLFAPSCDTILTNVY
jgi:hypothetical protein